MPELSSAGFWAKRGSRQLGTQKTDPVDIRIREMNGAPGGGRSCGVWVLTLGGIREEFGQQFCDVLAQGGDSVLADIKDCGGLNGILWGTA